MKWAGGELGGEEEEKEKWFLKEAREETEGNRSPNVAGIVWEGIENTVCKTFCNGKI